MKFSCVLAFAFLATQAAAFHIAVPPNRVQTKLQLENRINEKVDLDSPKVATMETIEGKAKKVYCRCWQSGTFPNCDGTHMKHNEKTGDNVGPLIVTVKVPES